MYDSINLNKNTHNFLDRIFSKQNYNLIVNENTFIMILIIMIWPIKKKKQLFINSKIL